MGATTMNVRVSGHSPPRPTFSASRLCENPRTIPTFARAAPAYPPINACDELLGSPFHQVIKSQAMAPAKPAMMT